MAGPRKRHTFGLPFIEETPPAPASEKADDDMSDDQESMSSFEEFARALGGYDSAEESHELTSSLSYSIDVEDLDDAPLAGLEPLVSPLSRHERATLSPDAAALREDIIREFDDPPVVLPWEDFPGADWEEEAEVPPSGATSCAPGAKGAWKCPVPGSWGDYYMSSEKSACPGCGGGRAVHAKEPEEMSWDIAAPKDSTSGGEQGKTKRGTGWLLFKKTTGFIGAITTAPTRSANPRPSSHHSNKSTHLFRALIAFGYSVPEALRKATTPFLMDGTESRKTMNIIAWLRKEGRWGKLDLGLGTKRFDVSLLDKSSDRRSIFSMNSDEFEAMALPRDMNDLYEESDNEDSEHRDRDMDGYTTDELTRLALPQDWFDESDTNSEHSGPDMSGYTTDELERLAFPREEFGESYNNMSEPRDLDMSGYTGDELERLALPRNGIDQFEESDNQDSEPRHRNLSNSTTQELIRLAFPAVDRILSTKRLLDGPDKEDSAAEKQSCLAEMSELIDMAFPVKNNRLGEHKKETSNAERHSHSPKIDEHIAMVSPVGRREEVLNELESEESSMEPKDSGSSAPTPPPYVPLDQRAKSGQSAANRDGRAQSTNNVPGTSGRGRGESEDPDLELDRIIANRTAYWRQAFGNLRALRGIQFPTGWRACIPEQLAEHLENGECVFQDGIANKVMTEEAGTVMTWCMWIYMQVRGTARADEWIVSRVVNIVRRHRFVQVGTVDELTLLFEEIVRRAEG